MDWLITNKEWVFSGVGIFIVTVIGKLILGKAKEDNNAINASPDKNEIKGNIVTINNTNNMSSSTQNSDSIIQHEQKVVNIDSLKPLSHILFIDDDANFKVVSILKKSGWINTKRVKDVKALDCTEVRDAQILFIDIQGVGRALDFKDEGLGLAAALKDKYPDKKIIIYSAETQGNRFHEALRKVDNFLPKNAEPYEFTQIVEEFSKELFAR